MKATISDLRELANLAAQTYLPSVDIICSGGVAALTFEDDDRFFVAIRGTVLSDFQTIARDLRSFPRPRWPGGLVHPGFWQGAHEVYQIIRPRVTKAQAAGKRIGFSGHSAGASMAIDLAAMVNGRDRIPSIIVALAPARGGGLTLRFMLRGCELHLARRANDIVPAVPILPPLYWHVAKLLHLSPGVVQELVNAHSVALYVVEFNAYLSTLETTHA